MKWLLVVRTGGLHAGLLGKVLGIGVVSVAMFVLVGDPKQPRS